MPPRSKDPDVFYVINTPLRSSRGRDSSVGIATHYALDGQEIESRWGRDFSALVQARPVTQPASCTKGTGYLSRG
jgi:hypothetical protein